MLLMPDNWGGRGTEVTFLSKYAALLEMLQRFGDVAIVLLTAFICQWLVFGAFEIREPYVGILLRTPLFVLLIFPVFGLYRSWRGLGVLTEIGRIAIAWSTVLMLLVISEWVTGSTTDYSRLWGLGWFLSTIVALGVHRWGLRRLLGGIRKWGLDSREVVVIGATHAGCKIIEVARNNPWMGLDVIGHVRTPYDEGAIEGSSEMGDVETFIESLKRSVPDQIWVALPLRAEALIQQLLEATSELPTTVRLVPDLFGYELLNQGVTILAGVPIITLQGSRVDGHSQVAKAAEDRILATLILLAIAPLMALIAICVKLSSPGPVLFKQRRHGLGGKIVEVWKFRTMRLHQEQDGHVTQATRGDPRVTRLGRFLRASSLDELPQFINVLQGRMSIVGPRPHAVEHNNHYQKLVRRYMLRHSMKPGITGWAQINGHRGETDTLEKMAKRVDFDIFYIKHWSVWFDLRIIALTIVRGFFHRSAY
ncbi:MAG TPA: undecaprenyl-phosphate glucose phosphotransferase [Xanthomonadaceae bacterium]|nr:undecaprenyl-phosphate glucose phosphotransferase [Xanthomonadaceae bacterium]